MEFTFMSSSEKPREACFDPGNIMNGTRIGTDFKLGSTVTYQCDSGYKIADPSSITCVIGADGKPAWNRVLPSCNGTYGTGVSFRDNFPLEFGLSFWRQFVLPSCIPSSLVGKPRRATWDKNLTFLGSLIYSVG